ncbi:MAG: sugar transporter subunit [Gammaproteobacteria bacterium]|jgi:PTS system ascorbate-specific IIA component|nr:sugar transporter subunit [Gammaproteobacteria bacterium]
MSVGVLLITHKKVGKALVDILKTTFEGRLPLTVATLMVSYRSDPDQLSLKLAKQISRMDTGDGVLILTDMLGATPCNVAKRVITPSKIAVIAGLNLPMLIHVMNYPALSLMELAEKALSGGKEGVCGCTHQQEHTT